MSACEAGVVAEGDRKGAWPELWCEVELSCRGGVYDREICAAVCYAVSLMFVERGREGLVGGGWELVVFGAGACWVGV